MFTLLWEDLSWLIVKSSWGIWAPNTFRWGHGSVQARSLSPMVRELLAPRFPTRRRPRKKEGSDPARNLYALPISEKQHIHPQDANPDQLQRLICKSVKNNTSTLRMQLEINCRDLSVRSANQWKTTHPHWGCNLRSTAETYLYALPISEKQHIHPGDANPDQLQRLICTLCKSVKNNTSTCQSM